MTNSPFKFLDSYTKEDKDIFFGREMEIEEVYTKIFQSKMLLVYGASGTGKSSLISCGLANKFQNTDWLPVNVRRGLDINASLRQQLEKQMVTPQTGTTIRPLTKILNSVYLDHFKPIFLIFDQFEELFIFGEREEWMDFARSVRSVLDSSLQARFVFIIRGEYLEYLTDLEEILPEFFTNRLRIEKMTRSKALNCISGPCRVNGIDVEDHFAENLLTKLSPGKTEIELTYLQVFLDRIFKRAAEKAGEGRLVFSNRLLEELGNIGDVLAQFLDEQIASIPESEKALALLKAFVSTDATKRQLSSVRAAEFVKTIGQDIDGKTVDHLIQELVNRRILKDKDEAGRYELRHDSIAAKIFEKITNYERDLIEVNQFVTYAFGEHEKRAFILNESDLAYIAPYETKLNFSLEVQEFIRKSKTAVQKTKRNRKQIYTVIGIISVLLVTTFLALIYSFVQNVAATKQSKIAMEQKLEAERQKELVLKEMKRGDSLRLVSEAAKRRADSLFFNFDTVVPMVIGPSIIASGAVFTGRLFLAGASSSHNPKMYRNGEPLRVETDPATGIKFGEIKFISRPPDDNRDISTRTFRTAIQIEGKQPLERSFDYMVMRPTVRITSGNANALYLNCGNTLDIECPALGASYNPEFEVTGGTIIKGDIPGRVILIPHQDRMEVSISNHGVFIVKEFFRSKPVPKPHYVAWDSAGRAVDLTNGILASGIGVKGSYLASLQVVAEAEENFKAEAPNDTKYEITSIEVTLARATARIDHFLTGSGIVDLKKWQGSSQPGDRIILEIKKAARINYEGELEPVMVDNRFLIVPIK